MSPSQALDTVAAIWHGGRLTQPPTIPEQIISLFVADDDDGNLTNGTPNYDALCEGLAFHGFRAPAGAPACPVTSLSNFPSQNVEVLSFVTGEDFAGNDRGISGLASYVSPSKRE